MNIKLIEKLSAAFGPSGCEDLVADIITHELAGIGVKRDALGSVIAHIPGKSQEKRILLSCGMDECSFMVNSVDDNGFIKFEPLTKTDPRALPGRRVMVGDTTVQAVGVVCSKPIHLQKADDRTNAPDPDKHAIDIGCTDKESAEKVATVGSYVVNHGEFATLGNDYIVGKALDSRVACAILIEQAKQLAKTTPDFDVYFVFTSKEKAGHSTLAPAAYGIKPTDIIIVDYSAENSIPKTEEIGTCKLGCGPLLAMYDGSAMYLGGQLYQKAQSAADARDITLQLGRTANAMSSAGRANLVGVGADAISIALPCQNPHTAASVMSISDIKATTQLLSALV